jgi:hypothetical protein
MMGHFKPKADFVNRRCFSPLIKSTNYTGMRETREKRARMRYESGIMGVSGD